MENILFIGKFNIIMQSINSYLSKHFVVQLSQDNYSMASGILQMQRPKLVLISLVGVSDDIMRIFQELRYNYPSIPVICIGTKEEQEPFGQFFRGEQFSCLERPINSAEILENICLRLKLNYDRESGSVLNGASIRKTILLIDDNAIQLRMLKEMLKHKYEVLMATSVAKAMSFIGKKVLDLIFMDYDLPVCDGVTAFAMLKEMEEAKDVPVVFLTGVKEKKKIEAVLALNPAGYILKPVSKQKLLQTVEDLIG